MCTEIVEMLASEPYLTREGSLRERLEMEIRVFVDNVIDDLKNPKKKPVEVQETLEELAQSLVDEYLAYEDSEESKEHKRLFDEYLERQKQKEKETSS